MKFIKIPDKDYEFQATQVTQEEWVAVMGTNPSYFKGDKLPVESVTIREVNEFIEKVNKRDKSYIYRLPNKEEWKHACNYGSSDTYFFESEKEKIGDYAWYFKNSEMKTQLVGLKKPNKYGLYDMLGNVWELTNNLYVNTLLKNNTLFYQEVLGGAFNSTELSLLHSSNNCGTFFEFCGNNVGLRLVRTKVILDTGTILPSEKCEKVKLSDALNEFKKKHPTFGEVQAFKAGWKAKK